MRALIGQVRQVVRDYRAAYGLSLGDTIKDALFAAAACSVLLVDAIVLLIMAPGK